ncbi:MAG: ATP-dependent Clp protease ATP-binding subunit, partial [Oscillospiraceae bacterium]|nr:ATP-dependent Clp protease ATP-binding subunit [Oscillospiraceae bacterium]
MQPVMCSRCKENVAVIFITKIENGAQSQEGLCLKCARELNIKPVQDIMNRMGISEENLEEMSQEMMNAFGGAEELPDAGGDDEEDGKTATFPFLNKLFSQNQPEERREPRNDDRRRTQDARSEKPQKHKFLDAYCISLTAKAREGRLDRMIGRDEEMERVIQILNRRQKNNPCLIGEPGVGKTAIAEGLAQRIVSGDVPYKLRDKEIYLLDLTALVAGTQFRGQFESRMKGLIEEIKKIGNIILVIDEVHTLVGAGDAEGSMNAANILKPALSRGEIQVIGATTFAEYRKHIEKDSALERRFQPVTVNEPTIEDTVNVLVGIKKYYEEFHRVHISDYLVRVCAVLSERYITDRFLPDKAIDLLDESCAYASIRSPEIGEYEKFKKEIAVMEDMEKSISEQEEIDYQALAEIKGKLIHAREKEEELKEKADNVNVVESDVTKVIERWTGIPASKIAENEFIKIAKLEDALKSRVLGQNEAVE